MQTKTMPIVVDCDKTLWRGRAAEGIGKAYLVGELKALHLSTVYRGYRGKREVEGIVKRLGGTEGEMAGQKRFYEILVENGLGRRDEMAQFAKAYIDSHIIESVNGFVVQALEQGVPVFLSTASGTSAASYAMGMEKAKRMAPLLEKIRSNPKAAEFVGDDIVEMQSYYDKYTFTAGVLNEEKFDSQGRLTGIEMKITDGSKKFVETLFMLDKHGLRLRDCMVIGDSEIDVHMLKAAGRAIASPFATEEVRRIKGIEILRA